MVENLWLDLPRGLKDLALKNNDTEHRRMP